MKIRQIQLAVAMMLIAAMVNPGVALAQAPATPTQDYPANGATDQPLNVSMGWHDPSFSADPKTYRVQVSQNSTFTSLILDQDTGTSTGWTVFNLSKNSVYYWRVNMTIGGQTSAWSPVWSFQITNKEIPGVPTLVSPPNGVTGLPDDPTLVWNAVEGATSYDIQLGTKPTFSSWKRTKWSYVGTSIRVFADLDDYSHTFYWRVRAKNAAGVSAWSAPWSFTCVTFGCD